METVKISDLQTVQEITGDEQIPVEYDGKNYKITPKQIAPFVDIENLQTFDSITGAEKVIVVKDGKAQGLVTLTQIRQVVLPGYTYEDIPISQLAILPHIISPDSSRVQAVYSHYSIELSRVKNRIFKITALSDDRFVGFAFLTNSLANYAGGDLPDYCENTGFFHLNKNETKIFEIPNDAKFIVINQKTTNNFFYEIEFGELLEDKVEELSARVNLLEQSAIVPAALDSVSREEFDALRNELEKLRLNTK